MPQAPSSHGATARERPWILRESGDHSAATETREALDVELLQEEEAEAKAATERPRPGLTMLTNASRLDDGAAGYTVAWKNG